MTGALLRVDDLCWLALRRSVMDALDHRGQVFPESPAPTEDATIAIVAAILTLSYGSAPH